MASVACQAQDEIKRMNEVKMAPTKYVFSQSIHAVSDSALSRAIAGVWAEVNMGAKDTISIDHLKPFLHNIVTTRDAQTRQFVYVSRDDIQTLREGKAKSSPTPHKASEPDKSHEFSQPSPLALQIMSQPDLKAVLSFLKGESSAGRIAGFGPLQSAPDAAASCIVVCAAESLKPIAILSPEALSGQRTNMLNAQPDSLSNYHGTYGLWYKQTSTTH